jgi:hypothetical protein
MGLCPNSNGQGAGYDPGMSQIRREDFQRFIMFRLRFSCTQPGGGSKLSVSYLQYMQKTSEIVWVTRIRRIALLRVPRPGATLIK